MPTANAPRPLSERALREAALVAREMGVTITVRAGARVYEFTPAGAQSKDKGKAESWEEAFD